MWRVLRARFHQGHRTMAYPDGPPPPLPERFRGPPRIDATACDTGCEGCVDACPTEALTRTDAGSPLRLDLGRCLFCTECASACPTGAITHSRDYQLAARSRDALVLDPSAPFVLAAATLEAKIRALFGRSLKLRQVSAGGCNACEADTNVLGTVGWDLGRFGISFVASPRHADGLFITGPVTQNMAVALKKTWDAVPSPKIVIATGACAISGGPYLGHPETLGGAQTTVPVDLFIPGCPPHPLTILEGLLRLIGRLQDAPGRLAGPKATSPI